MYEEGHAPLFESEADSRVPGQVVMKVAGGVAAMARDVPGGPVRLLSDAESSLPTSLGIPSLDTLLESIGATGVHLVHREVAGASSGLASIAEVAQELSRTYVVHLDEAADAAAAAETLMAAPEVEAAEPNRFREALATTPNDPQFSLEWGLDKVRAPEAWDVQRGDATLIVAVVDTGIDLNHPDLAGNLVPGQDLVDLVGVSAGAGFHFEGDVLTRDDVPQDEVGHGTHVAGTIGAVTDNAVGVAGVSWFCKLMPVRVLARVVRDADGFVSGTGTAVDIAAGIRWAVDHGASVINLSLGGPSDAFVERDAIAYAVASDVLVVAAMGNESTSTPKFPAAYPGVLAVGAIDQHEQRASFSNTGPHIGIAAPGVGVRSTFLGGGFADLSGTSMATPHVAGVGALVRSADRSLSAADTKARLESTARPLRDRPTDPVPNEQYGSGLVDAAAALGVGAGPAPSPAPPFPGRLLRFPPMTLGADVEAWQARMVERGFSLDVDGKYGPKSKAACIEFQQQQGLDADGIVGPLTWDAIFGPI